MPADFKVGESHEGERRRKRDWMERVSKSKRGRRLQFQEKWMLTLTCRGVVPVRAQKHHHQYSIYNPYLFYEEGNMLIWRHYGQSEEKCRKKHTFGFFPTITSKFILRVDGLTWSVILKGLKMG